MATYLKRRTLPLQAGRRQVPTWHAGLVFEDSVGRLARVSEYVSPAGGYPRKQLRKRHSRKGWLRVDLQEVYPKHPSSWDWDFGDGERSPSTTSALRTVTVQEDGRYLQLPEQAD
jgi:hypothetical protein